MQIGTFTYVSFYKISPEILYSEPRHFPVHQSMQLRDIDLFASLS
jgi:hypothetical protein